MHLPILPFQFIPVHLEAHALGLYDMQRFDIIPHLERFLLLWLRPSWSKHLCGFRHQIRQKVERLPGRWNTISIRHLQRFFCIRERWHLCFGYGKDMAIGGRLVMRREINLENFFVAGIYDGYKILIDSKHQ